MPRGIGFVSFSRLGIINLPFSYINRYLVPQYVNCSRRNVRLVEAPPYLTQLAMAEALECVRAAQLTIEIVHCIINADSTSKNNLGARFFTLYYGKFPLEQSFVL